MTKGNKHAFLERMILAAMLLAAQSVFAFHRPAANAPTDRRQYTITGIGLVIDGAGNIVGRQQFANPCQVVATITPAQVTIQNPQTGELVASCRYIGTTMFRNEEYRQYASQNNSVLLVDRLANLSEVCPQPDGSMIILELQQFRTQGVGQQMVSYTRPLWSDHDIPVYEVPSINLPKNDELFRIRLPNAATGSGSRQPDTFLQPGGGQQPGGLVQPGGFRQPGSF